MNEPFGSGRMLRGLVFIACLPVACAPAAARPPQDRPASAVTAAPARFDLRSSAWVNLHNILYGFALRAHGHATRGGGGGHGGKDGLETLDEATLSAEDRVAWDDAVAFYASAYAEREATFDDALADIANKLAARDGSDSLAGSGLPAALATHLERAMLVYEKRWWPADDLSNRAWIAALVPTLERYGGEVSTELARAYGVTWPSEPMRVDVAHYVYFAGAYTTLGPAHITLSSTDDRNQGVGGLESLFHEASHVVIRPLRDAFAHELSAQGKTANDLWHVVLFFSTGDAVRRQVEGYVPYAYRFGLYDGRWAPYRPLLERRWAPFLDARHGARTREDAVHDVVAGL